MYCTRCGKKIDYESFVCNECLQKEAALEQAQHEPVIEVSTEPEVATEAVATATAEHVDVPVNAEPTYSTPNQQYYYSNQNEPYTPTPSYQPQPTANPATPNSNPRMLGFGKALASTILSCVGYIFSTIAFAVAISELPGAAVFLMMMTLGMAIPALIMGIQSIKTFSRAISQGYPRPIATLVLGIAGVSMTAIIFFFCLLTLTIVGAL